MTLENRLNQWKDWFCTLYIIIITINRCGVTRPFVSRLLGNWVRATWRGGSGVELCRQHEVVGFGKLLTQRCVQQSVLHEDASQQQK